MKCLRRGSSAEDVVMLCGRGASWGLEGGGGVSLWREGGWGRGGWDLARGGWDAHLEFPITLQLLSWPPGCLSVGHAVRTRLLIEHQETLNRGVPVLDLKARRIKCQIGQAHLWISVYGSGADPWGVLTCGVCQPLVWFWSWPSPGRSTASSHLLRGLAPALSQPLARGWGYGNEPGRSSPSPISRKSGPWTRVLPHPL